MVVDADVDGIAVDGVDGIVADGVVVDGAVVDGDVTLGRELGMSEVAGAVVCANTAVDDINVAKVIPVMIFFMVRTLVWGDRGLSFLGDRSSDQ